MKCHWLHFKADIVLKVLWHRNSALMSQTERNPSIISFFIALHNTHGFKGVAVKEFEQLWKSHIMSRHERFQCRVPEAGAKCFEMSEIPFEEYCKELPHPSDREELKERISAFLTSPIDIHTKLWECEISSGTLGSSGAIIKDNKCQNDTETVFLFRNHHLLCDGVSLSTVVSDASDESDELNAMVIAIMEKEKRKMKSISIASRLAALFMFNVVGTIYALSMQFWNMFTSPPNPFETFTKKSNVGVTPRSISWKYLASVKEAKSVLKTVSKETRHATLNDMFVSILSSALEKQYHKLQDHEDIHDAIQSTINVVCPVHLSGGLRGKSIGNSIGAFVTTVPFNPSHPSTALSRLHTVSHNLRKVKRTPAARISWLVSSFISMFCPEFVAKYAMVRANCHAAAAISNVHGFTKKIHWMGRPVEMLCAFLPLPPKIPIGMVITSYDGNIIMSLDADCRVVPDADKFLEYLIEEYQALRKEAETY